MELISLGVSEGQNSSSKYFDYLNALENSTLTTRQIQGDQSYCPPLKIKDADKLVGK